MTGHSDQRSERLDLGMEITRALRANLADIAQEQHAGGYTFSFIAEVLGKLNQLFKVIFDADLMLLPADHLTRLTGFARRYNEMIHRIERFRDLPSDQKQETIGQIMTGANELYDESLPYLASAIALSTVKLQSFLKEQEEIIKTKKRELEAAIADFTAVMKKAVEDANSTVEGIRESAKAAGIVEHAGIFSKQAEEHQKAAWCWLGGMGLFGLITIGALMWSYNRSIGIVATLTTQQAIQFTITKLAVLSVLLAGLVWCGRSYRTQRHNHVVNKHRQNALSTFQVFSQSTADEPTKNAVLLQATQCIFSAQPTGYTTQESDSVPGPQILEIVRSVTGTQGKP